MSGGPWAPLLSVAEGLPLSGLDRYVDELLRWNRAIRLVGPRDRTGIELQVVDALLPFLHLPPVFPLLDIGSGAGLPGIPLALLSPAAEIVCLEPRTKRVAFLRHACRQLGLDRVRVVADRTEHALDRYPELQGFARTATARAVADTSSLLRAAAPFLHSSGVVILPRGGGDPPAHFEGWECTRSLAYSVPKPLGSRSVQQFVRSSTGECFT